MLLLSNKFSSISIFVLLIVAVIVVVIAVFVFVVDGFFGGNVVVSFSFLVLFVYISK